MNKQSASHAQIEQALVQIVAKVLQVAPQEVDRNEHLTALGLHSMHIVQVFREMEAWLGQGRFELKELYQYKTLTELSQFLDYALNEVLAGQLETAAVMELIQENRTVTAGAEKDEYDLSYRQRGLWLIQQMKPGSTAYNEHYRMRMRGPLDILTFGLAVREVIERHQIMRTVFVDRGGEPKQVILDQVSFEWPLFDLTDRTAEVQEKTLTAELHKDISRPFDLSTGPLFRFKLFQISEDEFHFYMVGHQMIFDDLSLEVLLHELAVIYSAKVEGKEYVLPTPVIQYADYAEWHNEQVREGGFARQEQYWLENIKKPLPVLDLPMDKPRPPVQPLDGDIVNVPLSPELSEQVNAFCREHGVSVYMTLLAVYFALLHRLTSEEDLIVGTPYYGRTMTEAQNLIGFFVNTMPTRIAVDGDTKFQDLLLQVKGRVLEGMENQEYPFERLVEQLNPDRDLSRSVLFNTMFNMLQPPEVKMHDLEISLLECNKLTVMNDMTWIVLQMEDHLHFDVEYNTSLFKEATVHKFIEQYQMLLAGFVADPSKTVAELDILTDDDRAVYALLNDTARDYDLSPTLVDAFIKQAIAHPERIALSYEGETMTYGELHERSNRLAHFLRAQGVQRNQLVALLTERSLEMMVGIYGIIKAGAAYVPIDPDYPANRVQYMITDSESAVLLTKHAYLPDVAEIAEGMEQLKSVLFLDDITEQAPAVAGLTTYVWQDLGSYPVTLPDVINEPTDIVYMIYTSGSTGQPKGVKLPHLAVVNSLLWMQEYFKLNERDVVAQRTSFCFDTSIWELFWPLREGARVAILSTAVVKDPFRLFETLVSEGVTLGNFVQSLFSAFVYSLEGMEAKLRNQLKLRWVLLAGEACQQKPINLWYDLFPRGSQVVNLYGPTEAAITVTSYIIEGKQESNITIGTAMPNCQLYVIDRQGKLCPVGVAGELCIGGVQLAHGYHNKPDKTAEAFVKNHLEGTPGDRLYRTGDLVRLRSDRNIDYVGRIDNQVKVRGYRIELGEIEERITEFPDVEMATVIVSKGPDGNNALFGFFTATTPNIDTDQMKAFIGEKLPDYMVPPRIGQIDAMPHTPNGKVDRKALAMLAADPNFGIQEREFKAPSTPTEVKLAGIWADVLKREAISADDHFFNLGGHSLLAMQSFNRIQKELNARVEIKDLFANPTLEKLAVYIDAMLTSGRGNQVVKIGKAAVKEHYPLSNAQKRQWFLYKFDPNSSFYNVPTYVRYNGQLNVDAFEQALNLLIARHDALRTVFVELEGEPRQIIKKDSNVRLQYEDVTDREEAEARAYVCELVQANIAQPFNLIRGPVVRAQLFKLSETEYQFCLNIHHIVTDGWSLGTLMAELSEAYEALASGEEPNLTPLDLQYVDYAEWQLEQVEKDWWKPEETYWVNTLAKPLPVLDLPLDFTRPDVQTFNGDIVKSILPAELTEQLRTLAQQQDVSMFMLTYAAYVMLMHHLTQNDDIIVGTPIAGRTVESLEPIHGFFVNTLALRTRFANVTTLQDLLQEAKKQCLDAYQHQNYPFDLLVEKIKPDRDLGRSAVFSTMFGFVAGSVLEAQYGSQMFEQVADELEHKVAKSDLTFNLYEKEAGIEAALEFNTDLFKKSTVERFVDRFVKVLSAFANELTTPIAELDLLSEEDRAAYALLNETDAEFEADESVVSMFEIASVQYPQHICLSTGDIALTYAEVNARTNQVAHMLLTNGLQKGDYVGIVMERSLETLISLLAAMKAGGVYVPIDIEYPEDRIQYMLEDSGAPLILTKSEHVERINGFLNENMNVKAVLPVDADLSQYADSNPNVGVTATDHAYVIYTSGSTGRPKGTLLAHRGVVNLSTWARRRYGINEQDTFIQFASFSFDASVWETFSALFWGTRLHLLTGAQRMSIEGFADAVQQVGATAAMALPTVFFKQLATYLSDEDCAKFATMKRILVAGEALPGESVRAWQRRFGTNVEIINGYGPTEATVCTTAYDINHLVPDDQANIPIGKPNDNYECYVMNDNGQLCPVGVPGELWIGSVGLALEYINKPEKTAEVFIPHPFKAGERLYRSGDIVRLMADGNIEFIGRKDEQVKVRGHRIEIGEIEDTIAKQHEVQEVAVIATKADGITRLIAYYTVVEGEQLEHDAIRTYLSSKLPDYMVPEFICRLDEMPITPNGKIDRKALSARDDFMASVQAVYVAPETDVQRVVADAWEQVLGVKRVGIHDDFFLMGGHSLNILKILVMLKPHYPGLKVQDFFQFKTVAELEQHIFNLKAQEKEVFAAAKRRREIRLMNEEPMETRELQGKIELERPRAVLLTGATGYLGAYVLYELLKVTDAHIFCLVRPGQSTVEERLEANMRNYFGESISMLLSTRVTAVAGDLASEGLGISPEQLAQLEAQVESIIHCGADTRHYGESGHFDRVNVHGTKQLIDIARRKPGVRFHHVSTLSVLDTAAPDSTEPQLCNNVYIDTKIMGERVVREAMADGVPATIFRSGNLICNAKTGQFQRNIDSNAFYRRIRAFLLLEAAPDVREFLDLTPIDYASRAIVNLALRKETVGRTMHICNPEPMTQSSFLSLLQSFGYKINMMKPELYQEWLFKQKSPSKQEAIQLIVTLLEEMNDREVDIVYGCRETKQLLDEAGITCDKPGPMLLFNLVKYAVGIHYFPRFKHWQALDADEQRNERLMSHVLVAGSNDKK